MKPVAETSTIGAIDDDATGLPWLRTWPRVYLFVMGVFIVWVVLLTALTMTFS